MNLQVLRTAHARLFARPSLYRANRFLLLLALRGIGVLNWEDEYLQGEAVMLRKLFADAPDSPLVIDVGANVGDYTQKVLGCAPDARIYAFEPVPANFEKLSARHSARGVQCVRSAVGDVDGTVTLYDHHDGEGTSHATLEPNVIERIHRDRARELTVPITRLDTFLTDLAISDVFLLKIDVEGREADVIRGLGRLLDGGLIVRNVQVEFNEMNVLSRTFLEDLAILLPGYRISRVLPGGRLLDITHERPALREIFAFQNLLFSRP